MFREMRRQNQRLKEEKISAILTRNTNGVLGVNGDDGYPYTVPISYVYHKAKIYFHCARTGHKIESIEKNQKVSFAIVDEDRVVYEEYDTRYQSVVIFGMARIIQDEEERLDALRALAFKYSGMIPEAQREAKVRGCRDAAIVGIEIQHITGKRDIARCAEE